MRMREGKERSRGGAVEGGGTYGSDKWTWLKLYLCMYMYVAVLLREL